MECKTTPGNMARFSVISANVQGLGNIQKRRDVFQYLRQKDYTTYFLCDTHFTKKEEKQIRAEWGYECYFSSYNSQSRGVAILFNNNFDFKVKKVIHDINGNYLIIVIRTMERDIALANIYGPNRDNPDFYSHVQNELEQLQYDGLIMGGDWNLVLNPTLDYQNYRHNNNTKAQEKVIEMAGELELVDIWREINPETLRYTWRRPNPPQQARLDFFLISECLLSFIKEVDIHYGYRSDHSQISFKLELKKEDRKNNFWKFNSTLLKDKNYLNEINTVIKTIKEQYAALVYQREIITTIPAEDLQLMISDQLFLDTLIMEIRKKSMEYSSKKKKDNLKEEKDLEEEIQQLEIKLNKSEDETQLLKQKKENLVNIRQEKMQGILIRSKARWAAQGEKINKYFCNMEKRHFVSKQMFKLIKNNGECTESTEEMVKEAKLYYENLYSKKETTNTNLENYVHDLPKLSESEADTLEGLITLEEAALALKGMKNGKSPGTDGITVDFLKVFWKQLGGFVVRSLNEGFKTGQMSITQREGIITCIPKGDKPREYLKNWRPISLLNVTYKIGSSCIASRIKTILPQLINVDQTGFVIGRYIGDNLRLIYDTIYYLKTKNLPGLLVSLDFEKAFDSIDWEYMFKVLKHYGFGKDICQWIEAFYNNIKSCIIVNGKASPHFNIQRGCRQGDPISPYLFVLCAELLACTIRENEDIKGVKLLGNECKISQFADDTTILLEGDEKSYEELFKVLNEFEQMSGLKLNYEKTCNIWLGSKRNSNVKYLKTIKMTWNPPQFKLLGLWFTNDLTQMAEMNITDKFNETKQLFNTWMKRSITPIGKVAILKSLILSKLVYLWIMLPNPPDHLINQLQKMCLDFIWDKKVDKVKRATAFHSVEKGGINIPHIQTYIKSLKISWMKKCISDSYNPKWKQLLTSECPEISMLREYGPAILEHADRDINAFWKDVITAYTNLSNKINIQEGNDILMEPIFTNDKFKINGKVFYCKRWAERNIFFVKDLLKDNGTFLNIEEFSSKYEIRVPMLDYFGCISAIKKFMRINNIQVENINSPEYNKTYYTVLMSPKGAKIFYEILLGKCPLPKPCLKWERIMEENINWDKVFSATKQIKEVKLKWFQMRINYRILVTNSVLTDMKIRSNNACTFCEKVKETIYHYLWECEYVQHFWEALIQNMKEHCLNLDRFNTLNPSLVLLGSDNKNKLDKGFSHILLTAKFFIYKSRINKIRPTIHRFWKELKQAYIIDKQAHQINMENDKLVKKWAAYLTLTQLSE